VFAKTTAQYNPAAAEAGKAAEGRTASAERELNSTITMYTVPSLPKSIVGSTPMSPGPEEAAVAEGDAALMDEHRRTAASEDEVSVLDDELAEGEDEASTVYDETAAVGDEFAAADEGGGGDDGTDLGLVVDSPLTFGVDTAIKKPVAGWSAAGVVALVGLGLLGWHFFGSSSNDKSGVAMAAAERPVANRQGLPAGAGSSQGADPAHPGAPTAGRQPIEGAQRQLLLNVEQCLRMPAGNVECRGYVTNLGAQPARITLDGADVVDGKGNSFNLNSNGQVNFSTGRTSSIAAGSRQPYTIKVPDKDPDAKTLTLYVDVNNPHGLEYTFRDIPIAEDQARNGG
jgi:hypothetical protein